MKYPSALLGVLSSLRLSQTKYLVWSGEEGFAYTWALYPIDENRTRLINRARMNYSWTKPNQVALDLFTEFAEHLAIPKILQGVKGRVEGHIESSARANAEFVIYAASLLMFLGAIASLLLRPLAWHRLLAGLVAGAAWLINWYSPIMISIEHRLRPTHGSHTAET